jgi:hypothetical protein
MHLLGGISKIEIVATCLDMDIHPYTALYSSIKGNGFADVLDAI